jgi:nitrogen regulatory protein P-II 1
MMTLTKVEAVIQPHRLDAVKNALIHLGIVEMTVLQAFGHGYQDGPVGTFRGTAYRAEFLPSVKIEFVVGDDLVEDAVDAIVANAATGTASDGKIFLSRIDDVVRIRNQQRGVAAL